MSSAYSNNFQQQKSQLSTRDQFLNYLTHRRAKTTRKRTRHNLRRNSKKAHNVPDLPVFWLITTVVFSHKAETRRTRQHRASGWFGANMRFQQLSERESSYVGHNTLLLPVDGLTSAVERWLNFVYERQAGGCWCGHLPAAAADTRLAATGDTASDRALLSCTSSLSGPVAARKRWFIPAKRLISGCLLAVKYSLISFIGRSGDQRRRQNCRPVCNTLCRRMIPTLLSMDAPR